MKIRKLEFEELYGFMNKSIVFHDKINLLVGINGCGKTSILNIIDWVLNLSLQDLCVTEFKLIKMHFEHNKEEGLLEFHQSGSKVLVNYKNLTLNQDYPNIKISLYINPKKLSNDEILKNETRKKYRDLMPEDEEVKTWDHLMRILNPPVVIGLNREVSGNLYDFDIYSNEQFQRYGFVKDPLNNVIQIANKEYSIYKTKKIALNQKLNYNLMFSAFGTIYKESEINEILNKPIPDSQQIINLEKKVTDYLEENKGDTSSNLNVITKYFSDLRDTLLDSNKKDSPLTYLMNINQINKIDALINAFESFEQKSDELFLSIKKYLDVINLFLLDSSKTIYFTPDTGEIKYHVVDRNFNSILRNNDIRTLSSGEKQILLQFTYFSFCNKKSSIFLVDEPELSLHPKWIENYLPSVESVISKDAQMFIATHSPVIVSSRKEYCIVLLSYN